jgi:MoaA/NifB/PqqE/SkfB family radical SAM enzyme
MSWEKFKLRQIHIELSTHCNAACPFCLRYYENTDLVRPDLKLNSISLDDFKKYFSVNVLKDLVHLHVCGTMGDPIMAKDCYEIFSHVKSINKNCVIRVHTNGGLRDEKFWTKMGELFQSRNMKLIFSIDGLEDTNHLYRRKVDWDMLMRNVTAFIKAGGNAYWEYLIFGHNEHQVELARELSKSMGFKEFAPKRAMGFDFPNTKELVPRPVYNKQGELQYNLYPPKQQEYLMSSEGSEYVEKKYDDIDLKTYTKELESKEISCKSHMYWDSTPFSEVYVNAQGIVFPCCYIGTRYDASIDYFVDHQLKSKINAVKDKLDLNNYNMEEIIQSGILDRVFADSWSKSTIGEGKMAYCAEICGKNAAINQLYVK